jgi:hypothetical protein
MLFAAGHVPTLPGSTHGLTAARSGQATHASGGELDYFVTNDGPPASGAPVEAGAQSDRSPVVLGGLRAGAEPPKLRPMVNGDASAGRIAGLAKNGMADLLKNTSSPLWISSVTTPPTTAPRSRGLPERRSVPSQSGTRQRSRSTGRTW